MNSESGDLPAKVLINKRSIYVLIGTLAILMGFLVAFWDDITTEFKREMPAQAIEEWTGELEPSISPDPAAQTSQVLSSQRSLAWERVNLDSVRPELIPQYKEVEGATLVRISNGLDQLRVGDAIEIQVPHESLTYKTEIAEVSRSLGVTSYSGSFGESAIPLRFLITVGQQSVYANFTTPLASYELVGNRHYAWLMDYAKIDQDLDYSKPDYYIPDESDLIE